MARYASNGSLDQSFGTGGEFRTGFPCSPEGAAEAVALLPNGQIVAAGGYISGFPCEEYLQHFVVVRLHADGSPDPDFGVDGVVTTPFPRTYPYSWANGLGLPADGKIVAAGGSDTFVLARYQGAADVAGVPTPAGQITKLALEAFPNPARGDVTFVLHAPAPSLGAAVEVVDVTGRVLQRWNPQLPVTGSQVLLWDGLARDGRRVPSGLYFVRASTPEGAVVRRVVLTN